MKYRGTVEVSNLSDENDEDDLDVRQAPRDSAYVQLYSSL